MIRTVTRTVAAVAMSFALVGHAKARTLTTPVAKATEDTIVVAGGCFWGMEAVYRHAIGVKSAVSGYAGDSKETANYKAVSSGKTKHAEAVQVIYDPNVISTEKVLEVFFAVHHPDELNKQGADVGPQYRSAVFYRNNAQKAATQAVIDRLTKEKKYKDPIVTEVAQLSGFYPAEKEHQNYVALHPKEKYVMESDAPRVEKFKKEFPKLVKK